MASVCEISDNCINFATNYLKSNNWKSNKMINHLNSNPFILGKDIPDELFCDRKKETEILIKQITNGRNVAIISHRRLGKSGLIHHCLRRPEIADNYHTFYVDLYATSSLTDFVQALGNEVYHSLKSRSEKFVERFFAMVQSLRAGFTVDGITGDPTFSINVGEIQSAETTMREIFSYLEAADKPCLVAIDEFQQIGEYQEKNIEALLRTHIQRCSNTSFIFSGSKRHTMSNMFNSPAKPFYQSAISMGLDPIPEDVYTDFACRMFAMRDRVVTPETVLAAYRRYEGYTWFVHMMLNELYSMTEKGQTCTEEYIDIAEDNILRLQEIAYESTLSMLSAKQKQVLLAIAHEGYAQSVTSGSFIKKHHLTSASSLQTALNALIEKSIVVRTEKGVRLEDFFFAMWLRRR